MYCCNYSGKSSPFIVRKKKDNSYYIKKTSTRTMLFRLKPIYPYRNSENLINPLTNPMYVALHNILCQIVIDDNKELCHIVKSIHKEPKRLFWSVSLKNGFITYKNNIYRNMENYHFIRIIYKSLFYTIIKLKVLLHRIKMRKIKRRLFLIGTQQEQSILINIRNHINSSIRKEIYRYL